MSMRIPGPVFVSSNSNKMIANPNSAELVEGGVRIFDDLKNDVLVNAAKHRQIENGMLFMVVM